MFSTIVTAIISFISTNIDDIFVLMIFYSQVGEHIKKRHIVIGQYSGIFLLLLISILGSMGLNLFPPQYTGLMGFIPIILGLKISLEYLVSIKLRNCSNAKIDTSNLGVDLEPTKTKTTVLRTKLINPAILNVFLVTIANGADNIGIYIPLFSRLSAIELMLTLTVFAFLIALWCFIGERLTNFPTIKDGIQKYKDIIVPVVFIGIGIFILIESNIVNLVK